MKDRHLLQSDSHEPLTSLIEMMTRINLVIQMTQTQHTLTLKIHKLSVVILKEPQSMKKVFEVLLCLMRWLRMVWMMQCSVNWLRDKKLITLPILQNAN